MSATGEHPTLSQPVLIPAAEHYVSYRQALIGAAALVSGLLSAGAALSKWVVSEAEARSVRADVGIAEVRRQHAEDLRVLRDDIAGMRLALSVNLAAYQVKVDDLAKLMIQQGGVRLAKGHR